MSALPGTGRRRFVTVGFRVGTYLALLFVIGPVIWILVGIIGRAAPHFSWSVLTHPTTGESGGLENAIIGTLLLMLGVLVIAGGIGILAGLHLAEYSKPRKSGKESGHLLRTGVRRAVGFPLDRARLRRLRSPRAGAALELLAAVGLDHLVDHGDPLYRQVDRDRPAPGPDRLP